MSRNNQGKSLRTLSYPAVWVPLTCFILLTGAFTTLSILGKEIPPIMYLLFGVFDYFMLSAAKTNAGNAHRRIEEEERRQMAVKQISENLGLDEKIVAHALQIELRKALPAPKNGDNI